MALMILSLLLGGGIITANALSYEPTADTEVQATIVDTVNESTPGGENTRPDWVLNITYAYEYDGERYVSGNVYPMKGPLTFANRAELREAMNGTYREGANVTAYIDADNPETSHLREAKPQQRLTTGVVVMLTALLIFGGSRKKGYL
jgi:hypothetical protein